MMTNARQIVDSIGLDDTSRTKFLGQMDTRICLHLVGRGKEAGQEFKSLADTQTATD